jgi:acetolactate synthase-1/3 small subunit
MVTDMNVTSHHTIGLIVSHGFNALSRIVGLFSGRGFTIDTITFGDAEVPGMARVTITTHGDQRIIEQITRQLEKLVDVVSVVDLTHVPFVSRDLALIKVVSTPQTRAEIIQVANVFRAKIVDISPNSLTIEVTGGKEKVDAAIGMFRPFGLREVARTGTVALVREYQGET